MQCKWTEFGLIFILCTHSRLFFNPNCFPLLTNKNISLSLVETFRTGQVTRVENKVSCLNKRRQKWKEPEAGSIVKFNVKIISRQKEQWEKKLWVERLAPAEEVKAEEKMNLFADRESRSSKIYRFPIFIQRWWKTECSLAYRRRRRLQFTLRIGYVCKHFTNFVASSVHLLKRSTAGKT